MEKLEQHQALFLGKLMGSDQVYDDIDTWIKNTHTGRNIMENYFKKLISLIENNIESNDVNAIIKKALKH